MPDDVRAAYANYGVTIPVEPLAAGGAMPADLRAALADYDDTFPVTGEDQSSAEVLTLRAARTPATPVQAAAVLLEAELDRAVDSGDVVTGESLAVAEEAAGLLFSPERAHAIAAAARAQVRDEYRADIRERGRQLGMLAGQNRSLREGLVGRDKRIENLEQVRDAVLHLVEGRPGTDLLTVDEILAAAGGGQPTGAPLAIRWDGHVMGPSGDTEGENTLVPCTTARGGPAALVLDDEQREKLGSLLGLRVRDVNAPCPTPGCGTQDDLDASDPELFGWSRLEVAALGDGPRWFCSDMCVFDELARAGHDLDAADREAEQGGDL